MRATISRSPHEIVLQDVHLHTGQRKERLTRLADDFRDPHATRDLEQLDRRRGGRLDLASRGLDGERLRHLVAGGLLTGVQHLDLGGNRLDADAIGILASSPALADLRWLELSDNPLGSDGLWTLLHAPWVGGLRGLSVRRCGIDHHGVLALGDASVSLALTRLDLSDNPLGTAGGCALARARLPRLRHLALGDTRLGPDVGRALADAPGLDALDSLALDGNPLQTEGLLALLTGDVCHQLRTLTARATGLDARSRLADSLARLDGALRHLDLSHNALGDGAVVELLGALDTLHLDALGLAATRIGPRTIAALATSDAARGLRRLDLADNTLRDDDLDALGQARWLPGLRELDVSGNPCGGRALADVLRPHGALPRLSRLALARTRLGSDGLERVLDAVELPSLLELQVGGEWLGASAGCAIARRAPRLRRLGLRGAQLGSDGVERMLAGGTLRNLVELDLGDNALGDTGAAALADAQLRHLRALCLANDALGALGLQRLATSRTLAGVTDLDLSGNPLGRGGAAALAAGASLRHVVRLDLSRCSLDTEALAALASTRHLVSLRSLALGGNLVGDRGVEHLLASSMLANVHTLALNDCGLGDRAARLLGAAAEALPVLSALDLSRNTLTSAGVCALWRAPHLQHMRVLALDLGLAEPTLCIELLTDRTLPGDTRRAAASLLTGSQLRTAARRCNVSEHEVMSRYELVRAVVGE